MAEGDKTLTEAAERISAEILKLHQESYGVGGEVKTRLLTDEVLVLIDVELSRAERTLVEAGHDREVRQMREAFQAAIAPSFKALVERNTGRRVESFVSHMNMDPPYSVELFRLAPRERYQTS